MSTALTMWQKLQLFYQGILENGDRRTEKWLMVSSPVPISSIVLCYLVIIGAGPKLVAKRTPVNLETVLRVYNFAMLCLSAYMVFEFAASSWMPRYSLLCQPVDYSDSPLAVRGLSLKHVNKFFFILRKKNSQLTFLRVHHHATMVFNWWAGVKYVAGGQSFLIGLINSLVHVVMNLYYGLAALGLSVTKYLWWKQHLTSLQLLQFFIIIHSSYNLFAHCDFPDSMNVVVWVYSASLIVLFCSFCYHTPRQEGGQDGIKGRRGRNAVQYTTHVWKERTELRRRRCHKLFLLHFSFVQTHA
ncbi:hypothetical protein Q5P01_021991 [Channa striata]|uniref:Elongation of very long chain fatty acids protein n=1 Tax=Channa striata TaxID=64152 RepID=A0AA88J4D1_CHASR|nr:hypothetical protein Q5P01_021991 [Channa striata]